ncbi:MAG: hypothetical protein RLO50_00705 [Azospirillaceae bacterium]
MTQVAPTPGLLALAAKSALLENQPDLALRLASAAGRLEPGMADRPGIVFEALVRLGATTEILARLAGAYGAADPAAGDVHVMHFRAGGVGGLREAFEAEACREMFEAIPVEARDRFGWAP